MGERPVEALLSLGSNIEPAKNLPAAVRRIAERFVLRAVSAAWETLPVGPPGQPAFLNAAAVILTSDAPGQVRSSLRGIERDLGRRRPAGPYEPRPIDLDLTLYAGLVVSADGLRVPDPALLRHAFVAVPAAEVAPAWRHPETGETLQRIASRLLAELPAAEHPRRAAVALGWSRGAP